MFFNTKKQRSFLKWVGGKYFLLEEIKKYLLDADCLVEPFVGSGILFLNTNYNNYILADINSDLINLYNIVKNNIDYFVNESRKLFNIKYNTEKEYYRLRNEFNISKNYIYRSILFLYLNHHGYNGLCRYNLKGDFNVPFGFYKKPYFPEDELYIFSEKAQNAIFLCQTYQKTLSLFFNNAIIYCDPPYMPLSKTSNFVKYYSNDFNISEQNKLAEIAFYLSYVRGIPILISNNDTPVIRKLYHFASINHLKIHRRMNNRKISSNTVNELLIIYYPFDTVNI